MLCVQLDLAYLRMNSVRLVLDILIISYSIAGGESYNGSSVIVLDKGIFIFRITKQISLFCNASELYAFFVLSVYYPTDHACYFVNS